MNLTEEKPTIVVQDRPTERKLNDLDSSKVVISEMETLLGPEKGLQNIQDEIGTIPLKAESRSPSGFRAVRLIEKLNTSKLEGYRWEQVLREHFLVSQKWEGVVTQISNDSFIAQLRDLTNPSSIAEEEAELPLSDVSPDDLDLFIVGAYFYFSVGYRISESGGYERSSRIRFRRLPTWTENELLNAAQRAADLQKRFHIE